MEKFFKHLFKNNEEEEFEHLNSAAILKGNPNKNKEDLEDFEQMVIDKNGDLGLESYSDGSVDQELAKIRARQSDTKEKKFEETNN